MNIAPEESFEEQVPEAKRASLARRLIAAGPSAPKVLMDSAIDANGAWASEYLRTGAYDEAATEELVERMVRAHVRLARSEGAAIAAALTAAEMGTIVGTAGSLTAPAAITGIVTDLAGLAWIQVRMVLTIAALHGHNPQSAARYQEIVSLMGIYGAPQAESASKAVGNGASKAITRLTMRHLKGKNLQTIKSLFDVVGIKFTRVGVIKVIPFVNVPISAVVNGGATKALGKRAELYYRTLPSPSATSGR